MFPVPEEKLAEMIVGTLAKRRRLTVSAIQERLEKEQRLFSVQAIYKELRKLQAQGVVFKDKEQFALRAAWVVEAAAVMDSIYDTYIDRSALEDLIPAQGGKSSLRFGNLNRLVSYWSQVLFLLARVEDDVPIFEYAPHVWFHLANSQDEIQFLRALEIAQDRYYLAVGGDTFLDRTYERIVSSVQGEICFGQSVFGNRPEDYLSIAGDCVITVRLGKKLADAVKSLFCHTRSQRDLRVGEVSDLFSRADAVRFTIENNPKKAARLRRKFADFFGVTLS